MPPILVLSLKSAIKRREDTTAELARYDLPFRFFDAPVAGQLDERDVSEHYDADTNATTYKSPLSPGEIACYLGHIAMWREIAASAAYEPIGTSCRICERRTCHQRSVPPLERRLTIDADRRGVLPYQVR